MEPNKCSYKTQSEINAIIYCKNVINIYVINVNLIIIIYQNGYHKYNLNENINEIFTGICKEQNHKKELEFFCKNHNQLCCPCYLCKLKVNGYGQHSDCDICLIDKIKDERK